MIPALLKAGLDKTLVLFGDARTFVGELIKALPGASLNACAVIP